MSSVYVYLSLSLSLSLCFMSESFSIFLNFFFVLGKKMKLRNFETSHRIASFSFLSLFVVVVVCEREPQPVTFFSHFEYFVVVFAMSRFFLYLFSLV